MTAKIYSTDDMEASVRLMVKRNDKVAVWDKTHCLRPIRPRYNFVYDIPSVVCRPWDEFAQISLERWNQRRNLLFYRPWSYYDLFPEVDAMLWIEAPLKYSDFHKIAKRVSQEIIIYRPPEWVAHDETVNFRNPHSSYYKTLLYAIENLRGGPLTWRQHAALEFSGCDPKKTTVFMAEDILQTTGICERLLKALLGYKFRGHYHRYHCYTPQIEPEEPDHLEMYRILENEPDVGRGMRMLRFGELHDGSRVRGFKPILKWMVKQGYVSSDAPVYILEDGFKPLNYQINDAINNVRRGEWFKMMNIVDDAPEYLHLDF